MDKLSERWDQFIAGEEEAFAWLYKNHASLLYEYGMRFTSDDDLVKDCMHDLFLALYKNKKNITKPRNIKAYLLVSLKNRLLNALKHSSLSDRAEYDDYMFDLVDSVEDEYIESESEEAIKKIVEFVLSKLSPRQKEIIYYRYIQELTMDEICELMDLSYQSAQNLIQKAFHKISTNEELIKNQKLNAGIIMLFLCLF